MIVDRQFPRTFSSLVKAIERETGDSKIIAVNAGHFLLHFDDETGLVPCIASEIPAPRFDAIRSALAEFPLLSWKVACKILAALPAAQSYLLVIVNDWQYVPPGTDRKKFYASFDRLPSSYVEEARSAGSGTKLLTPRGPGLFFETHPYFSERALRNQYQRRVKRLIKQNALPDGAEISVGSDNTVCNLIDVMGGKREIYCSSKDADCSSEVAELIHEAFATTSCDTFINLYPDVCKDFVEAGSEISSKLFQTGVSRVLNLALPAIDVSSERDLLEGAEMAVHRF